MAQHHVAGEVVVGLGLGRVVLDVRDGGVDRRDVGVRARRHERDQAEMVDVLVGEDHEADVLEPVPERLDPALQLVQRGARVGPGVDERERLVLDQVDVHAPDRERRGDGEPVDARRGRGSVRVGARHEVRHCTFAA